MAKPPKPDTTALTVRERMLLFCVGSGTDWQLARRHRATAFVTWQVTHRRRTEGRPLIAAELVSVLRKP